MSSRLPPNDPRARHVATSTRVDHEGLVAFLRPRHHWVLATRRRDGSPQMSPVTGGTTTDGRLLVATYPSRAKTRNARRDPRVSILVLSDDFGGPWVQLDGEARVVRRALTPTTGRHPDDRGDHHGPGPGARTLVRRRPR